MDRFQGNGADDFSLASDSGNSNRDAGNEESSSTMSRTSGNTIHQHGSSSGGEEEHVISKQETQAVWRLKFAVLLVLAASASAVAATAYFYLSWNEQSQFRKQFREDSHKIFEAIGSNLDKTFGLMDHVAVTMVSTARLTNQTWPFVTIPNFAVRMAKLLPLTDAFNIVILPIVTPANRKKWETYAIEHVAWVNEGVKVQSEWDGYYGPIIYDWLPIEKISGDFGPLEDSVNRSMTPTWQNFPVVPNLTWSYNYDWSSVSFPESYLACLEKHVITISKPYMIPTPGDTVAEAETKIWAENFRAYIGPDEETVEPIVDISYPIIDEIDQVTVAGGYDYSPSDAKIVAMVGSSMYYRSMLEELLPEGSDGIRIVFDNPCTEPFTYEILGPSTRYLGVRDSHEEKYNGMGNHTKLLDLAGQHKRALYTGARADTEICPMTIHIYPSSVMEASFTSENPKIFTVAVVFIFAFTSLVFFCYDAMVERRQRKVLSTAVRSSAIVSSLFPSTVRDRLYPEAKKENKFEALIPDTAKGKFQSFIRDTKSSSEAETPSSGFAGSPIAELYPETTVLFADIVGFTSWSSTRQPCQVFTLLETLYAVFDSIARQRGVFKVETIGDCYVAVVGLPTPKKHHAVVMAKFASDCRLRMSRVVEDLEKSLGPGTADLALRCGLNSGPTTAGVLRGEKSRFQLFGDTVNTAARMESSGDTNRLHVSQKTADLIEAAGKGHWLTIRDDEVNCKGKGFMKTYWCEPLEANDCCADTRASAVSKADTDLDSVDGPSSSTLTRLIDWNVDMFTNLLKKVVSQRVGDEAIQSGTNRDPFLTGRMFAGMPIDEVKEVLSFQHSNEPSPEERGTAKIKASALDQLRSFVSAVAATYKENPFHNFEHCCHVAMSTKKLLDRITESSKELREKSTDMNATVSAIITDPLAQFALVFAALVHDVDHPGVSNAHLVREEHALAATYENRSVAEQNSIDIAWNLLMAPQFVGLRACLFASEEDVKRFRQIVVNSVMATDLFDKELKSMRDLRWDKSFADTSPSDDGNDSNRRASIIIDLIIQASDVSHTMQHFTVYKKWNMKLLTELHDAYKCGRNAKDPTEGWYDGELWFFDNYVIPLAQKLRECGVFGVSCDEFLDYARDNRMEWERKGRAIVQEAKDELLGRHDTTCDPVRVEL